MARLLIVGKKEYDLDDRQTQHLFQALKWLQYREEPTPENQEKLKLVSDEIRHRGFPVTSPDKPKREKIFVGGDLQCGVRQHNVAGSAVCYLPKGHKLDHSGKRLDGRTMIWSSLDT